MVKDLLYRMANHCLPVLKQTVTKELPSFLRSLPIPMKVANLTAHQKTALGMPVAVVLVTAILAVVGALTVMRFAFAQIIAVLFPPLPSPSAKALQAIAIAKLKFSRPPGTKEKKKDEDLEAFRKVYSQLTAEFIHEEKQDSMPAYGVKWLREMMDYTVPHGKMNRGLAVLDAVRVLSETPRHLVDIQFPSGTTGELYKARLEFAAMVCGWGIEFLQAFFLVADDIMDDSITRRGMPCWYRQLEGPAGAPVGMNAVNDGILLESMIYRMLATHCGTLPCYPQLIDLFHNTTSQTASGQLIDIITAPIGQVDLTKYTMNTYLRIVEYKTAYYTFYLPIACAMALCGIEDKKAYNFAKTIAVEMGTYFQIQDDYLDCYGDEKTIGKVGTDIEDNKCSWLVVKALEMATPAQKKIVEEHYGQKEKAHVLKIKELYKELSLEAKYLAYEEESHNTLQEKIKLQTLVPPELFLAQLKKIYKRTK